MPDQAKPIQAMPVQAVLIQATCYAHPGHAQNNYTVQSQYKTCNSSQLEMTTNCWKIYLNCKCLVYNLLSQGGASCSCPWLSQSQYQVVYLIKKQNQIIILMLYNLYLLLLPSSTTGCKAFTYIESSYGCTSGHFWDDYLLIAIYLQKWTYFSVYLRLEYWIVSARKSFNHQIHVKII